MAPLTMSRMVPSSTPLFAGSSGLAATASNGSVAAAPRPEPADAWSAPSALSCGGLQLEASDLWWHEVNSENL